MVKLGTVADDGAVHVYCLRCRQESLREGRIRGYPGYKCQHCGYISLRALIIDPAVRWWLDDAGEYWHATAGVFVSVPGNKYLFFKRTKSS